MFKAVAAREPEYYLERDCPIEGLKIEARYGGKGARLMGLGEFGELSFLRLAKGLNPETGSKLTARLKENRIDGTDYTFTVPKWIAAIIEVGGDERAKAAVWDTNDYAMGLLEEGAAVRERKGGVYRDRRTGNMTWASFYHGTTRPIEDVTTAFVDQNGDMQVRRAANNNRIATPDPHSHIHNYLLNVSYDPVEDQWKALKRHRFDLPKIEEKANKRLAKRMRKLGYPCRVESKVITYASIDEVPEQYRDDAKRERGGKVRYTTTVIKADGFPEGLESLFSRRQAGVKAEEASKPYLHAEGNRTFRKKMEAAKAQLSQVVREEKATGTPMTLPELRQHWVERMSDAQRWGLESFVNRARIGKAMDRFHQSLSRHASMLRSLAVSQESGTPGPEREQSNGRTR
jgi:hypothetical protein